MGTDELSGKEGKCLRMKGGGPDKDYYLIYRFVIKKPG